MKIAEDTHSARTGPESAIPKSVRSAAVEIGRTITPREHQTIRALSFLLSSASTKGKQRAELISRDVQRARWIVIELFSIPIISVYRASMTKLP